MTSNLRSLYKRILRIYKNLVVLGSTESIIHWDMETMMPPKALEQRSEQLALLSQIHHKMSTSPTIKRLTDNILKHPLYEKLTEQEKRNIYLIKKNYDEQAKLPTKLVAAIAKQQALTVNIWKKAKAAKNFALFKPELQKLVNLTKESAEILMEVKQTKTPYDAFLDIYEPQMTTQTISNIFDKLNRETQKLMDKIVASQNQPDVSILQQNIPVKIQKQIATVLAQTVGYEVNSPTAGGRIDETEHPFTTGYYNDVRITTHYHPNKFTSAIFSILHETGHALYEQGLPEEWKYQPIGSPCSMGFHESQSRLYENMIGKSLEFWTALIPKIKTIFSENLSKLDVKQYFKAINEVRPSKIRIEADEITYNLHIIIRFQIERDLFSDKITVDELPTAWNQKYREYLGLKVENDSEGVMQDTHWASGLYGYFPTYSLGNIYAGQIIENLQKEYPKWNSDIAKDNFTCVKSWLAHNIYGYGNLYDPFELLEKATGSRLTVDPYISYLQSKFSRLYMF